MVGGMMLLATYLCYFRTSWIATWLVAATWFLGQAGACAPTGSILQTLLGTASLLLFLVTCMVLVKLALAMRRRNLQAYEDYARTRQKL